MNRRHLILISIATLALLSSYYFYPTALKTKLTRLVSSKTAHPSIGLLVQDVKSGKTLYSQNANQYFVPASNQKIITATAALASLGENFRFETVLRVDPKAIAAPHLTGDVTVVFSGDPSLQTKDLVTLFKTLKAKDIDNIDGDIVLDDSFFDNVSISPGSSWEDLNYCWSAPIKAATLNQNCVSINLLPGLKKGDPLQIVAADFPQPVIFINKTTTAAKDVKSCTIDLAPSKDKRVLVTGCLPLGSSKRSFSIANPHTHAGIKQNIAYALEKNKITLTGQVYFSKASKISAQTQIVASHHSVTLGVLLKKMLKDSDNLIANTIFKTLGARLSHQAGSFKNGAKAVHDILKTSLNVDIPSESMVDGSGESRYNVTTPESLVLLLQNINKSSYSKIIMDALPIAGIDGSLKHRLQNNNTKNKILAKTGTMTGVTALSGYIKTNQHKTLAFSILINGFAKPASEYKAIEDKICALLVTEKS